MDETKTRKQEALELLALDTLTDEQKARLNRLTMERAYPGLEQRWYATGTSTPVLVPRYCASVDACLTLPKPDGYFWTLQSNMEPSGVFALAFISPVVPSTIHNMHLGATLPIAMLKAWWLMQSD